MSWGNCAGNSLTLFQFPLEFCEVFHSISFCWYMNVFTCSERKPFNWISISAVPPFQNLTLIDFWKQTFNFDLQNAPNYFEINLFHLPNKVVTANKSHWIRKQFAIDRIGIENSKKYWQVHRQDILNALTICLCHSNEEQEQQKKKDREGEEWHSMRAWALCPQLRSVSKVFCATAKDCA